MSTSVSDRVVAITGASSGIGSALARRLGAAGAKVVVSARRSARLEALVEDITRAGGQAMSVTADVTSPADMDGLVAATIQRFGRIDVMVANAGIGYHGALDDSTPEAMQRLVEVNLLGTFHAAKAALVPMRRQGHGHIIAISSIVGRRGVSGSSIYSATKAGQLAFIESLRAEFAGSGLHASVVLPVATKTEFHDAIRREFGHTTEGRGPRQSVDDVARAIESCIARPRPEVYPMRSSRLLAVMNIVAPALTDRFVRRFGRRRGSPA